MEKPYKDLGGLRRETKCRRQEGILYYRKEVE
jgi:hypothetical protein